MQKIMFMLAGKVRHRVLDEADKSFTQKVFVKTSSTEWARPNEDSKLHISEVYQWLSEDEQRNTMIIDDVIAAANEALPDSQVLVATGKYIGEGFDLPRLDTLFITLPISWKGTLAQYAGRIHRAFDDKEEVRIYDYVEQNVPMLNRMYKKREKGYLALGYTVENSDLR